MQHVVAQQFLDHTGVMLVGIDASEKVVLISNEGCVLLGYERPDILGHNWFDCFIPERLRDELRSLFHDILEGKTEIQDVRFYESPILHRDGFEVNVNWHNTILRRQNGEMIGLLGIGELAADPLDQQEQLARFARQLTQARRDVEQEKAARQGVAKAFFQTDRQLRDYRHALDQACIVAITDARGTITHANDQFCRISKYSREELIGQNHRIINSGYHPPEFFRDMWTNIGSGKVWRADIRNRAKDGTIYWVDTTIVPFVDEDGKPFQYLAIRHDITQKKQHEEQLRNQAALTQLGAMAAVVAHEVKNPLAGIAGAVQIIGKKLPEASRERAVISDVLDRIGALNETIADILSFARPHPPQLASVTIQGLVNDTVGLFLRDPALKAMDVTVEGNEATVRADPVLLGQDLLNILINATQAMNHEGAIRIAFEAHDGCCVLTIHDSGPGIPQGIRAQIFEPFFTTKGRGTGLGLPTAKRHIEAMGGTIDIECPSSGGTKVTIRLPLVVTGS